MSWSSPASAMGTRGLLYGVLLSRLGCGGLVALMVVAVLVVGGLMVADSDESDVGPSLDAKVTRVIDGDTVVVSIPGESRPARVRLLGVDAPEVAHAGQAGQCWGGRSRAALRRLVSAGSWIELRADGSQPDRDRYGRMLRYVEDGGDDVGEKLIRHGDARAGVGDFEVARLDTYKSSANQARAAERGLWGSCQR